MWGRYPVENLARAYRETRVRQKALASLSQLLNEIDLSLGSAPSATASPLGRAARDDQSASTKIGARAKTSRRK